MSTLESVEITPQNLTIICETCVAKAKIHHVSPLLGFRRIVRIECHGVSRLVGLDQYASRVAEYCTPGRVNLLWCQMADVVADADLKHYVAKLVADVEAIRHLKPEAEEHRVALEQHVAAVESLVEHARAVIRSRCGESR